MIKVHTNWRKLIATIHTRNILELVDYGFNISNVLSSGGPRATLPSFTMLSLRLPQRPGSARQRQDCR